MAFLVHISDADRAYLDNLPLSERAKKKIDDFIDYAIAQVDDAYRMDPPNRPQLGGSYFQRDLLLLDGNASGQRTYHKVRFIIQDDHAAAGVLLVVFVDHQKV